MMGITGEASGLEMYGVSSERSRNAEVTGRKDVFILVLRLQPSSTTMRAAAGSRGYKVQPTDGRRKNAGLPLILPNLLG